MDRERAFHATERALEWGQSLLQFSTVAACSSACTASSLVWHQQALPVAIEDVGAGWWQQYAIEYGHDPLLQGDTLVWPDATTPPQVIIEELQQEDLLAANGELYDLRYYRVYANGYGAIENSHVILASTVAVPYALGNSDIEDSEPAAVPCSEAESVHPDIHCGRLGWREIH